MPFTWPAVVVIHALWRHLRPRTLVAVLVPCAVSALGLLAYHQALYGFWDPRRVYGRRPEFALSSLPEGLPGLLAAGPRIVGGCCGSTPAHIAQFRKILDALERGRHA